MFATLTSNSWPQRLWERWGLTDLLSGFSDLVYAASILAVAALIALIVHMILFRIISRLADSTDSSLDNIAVKHLHKPARNILLLIAVNFTLPFTPLSAENLIIARRVLYFGWIGAVAFLLVKFIRVIEDVLHERFDITGEDNLRARKVFTQFQVFKKTSYVIICILALAIALLSFEITSKIGTSILASAGVIGIIVGVAAQRTLSNLLAGIQIAMAQPIRIEDVVVVENEWGRIEEITLTYVVVRIWDMRRLVLPISYFIEKPIQNWTRQTANILGTVFIYADYSLPVQEVREQLLTILQDTPLWDGSVWNLQVTNATEHTVELRALMSAADASKSWNLRCLVREKLLEFIRDKHPQSLPKVRGELFSVSVGQSSR